MSGIAVAAYRDAHFGRVRALWHACFPDDPPWNRAEASIPAKLSVQPELFLVALDGEAVVGTAMGGYDGHRGWLHAVAVAPTHRRRGIAALLIREAERRIAAMGCAKLNLQVRVGNDEAVALYEALGFAVEERVSMGKRLAG